MVKSIENIYLPHPARITRVIAENAQIKTFELAFTDSGRNQAFTYRPGQFMMVSIPDHGEAPISISSAPSRPGHLELSVRQAGHLSTAMHAMVAGDLVGLRGPYGRPFPVEACLGRDLVFVAGGIGLAPLRSLLNFALDHREDFGTITLLYGSRSPQDIAFSEDIRVWRDEAGVECLLTVDVAAPGWQGAVGLVTNLLTRIHPDPARATGICCGPSVMIRAVLTEFTGMGLSDEQCITTLERHMKCGIGVCRHCHLDSTLVCVDGPVFTLAQLRRMGAAELA